MACERTLIQILNLPVTVGVCQVPVETTNEFISVSPAYAYNRCCERSTSIQCSPSLTATGGGAYGATVGSDKFRCGCIRNDLRNHHARLARHFWLGRDWLNKWSFCWQDHGFKRGCERRDVCRGNNHNFRLSFLSFSRRRYRGECHSWGNHLRHRLRYSGGWLGNIHLCERRLRFDLRCGCSILKWMQALAMSRLTMRRR